MLGASTSYHLTKLGAEVTIIDPRRAPTTATARSAGLLLHYANEDKCRLVRQTVTDVAELEDVLDEDLGFKQTGTLRVALTPEEAVHMDEQLATMRSVSAVSTLTAKEAARRVPWMDLDDSIVGDAQFALSEADGFIDPVVLAGGFSRAARAAGASLVTEAVVSLVLDDAVDDAANEGAAQTRVCGVRTTTGELIECDHVVDVTGAWSGVLGEAAFGMPPLPMAPIRSHYWTTGSMPDWLATDAPMVILPQVRSAWTTLRARGLMARLVEGLVTCRRCSAGARV